MRWDYNDKYREGFETCEHRDILIVPHATKITKVKGGPPEIRSKIPLTKDGSGHPTSYRPVEFIITNEDIYKEKFEWTNSLNSSDNLTFASCESAMVKFTIRNNKTYDETTGQWIPDIPNLQYYSVTGADGKLITGQVQTHYIIEVYMYFNGDSDTMIYLGMFIVEEDKVSADGYSREITAYDFLLTLRDMDIINWYKHLFDGINMLDDDFSAYFKDNENKKPDNYDDDANWIRKPKECWTIGEALKDIFRELINYHPENRTVDQPDEDYYQTDENPYIGYGMPIKLDPDLFDYSVGRFIPLNPYGGAHERYGYMEIFELPFYKDEKLVSGDSLSLGKFLEDIGILAGRYPFIRLDQIDDHDYIPPDPADPTTYYNTYERCILSFKPLPRKDEPITVSNYLDSSDIVKGFKHDIYTVDTVLILEVYNRDNTKKPIIKFHNLTEEQQKLKSSNKDATLKTFQIDNNTFTSYLSTDVKKVKGDEKEAQALIDKYKTIIKLLDEGDSTYEYPESCVHDLKPYIEHMDLEGEGGFLHKCYKNIKYRTYVPYELTTFADPVRDTGDRIHISFEDKVTGEKYDFDTYILQRTISGIQKMMDKYTAKGDMSSNGFMDYKSNSKSFGGSYNVQSFGVSRNPYIDSGSSGGGGVDGITPNDLCEYLRNVYDIRFLDEPSDVSVKYIGESSKLDMTCRLIVSSADPYPETGETNIHNGSTNNPIIIYGESSLDTYNVSAGDYLQVHRQGDGYEYPEDVWDPVYLFDGSKWVYSGDHKFGYSIFDLHYEDNSWGGYYWLQVDELEGDYDPNDKPFPNYLSITKFTLRLVIDPEYSGDAYIIKEQRDNTDGYIYSALDYIPEGGEIISDGTEVELKYGDLILYTNNYFSAYYSYYQYPGVIFESVESAYPVTDPPTIETRPYVEIKWSDPVDYWDSEEHNIQKNWQPIRVRWDGTIVVRKENSEPKHRWDGTLIVETSKGRYGSSADERDKYKVNGYKDYTIEPNKVYYYGIFPYFIQKYHSASHEPGEENPAWYEANYRFTKTVRVETGVSVSAPVITSIVPKEANNS